MAGNNINSYSYIEPLGHEHPKTKIERYWSSFWGPYSLTRSRTIEYAHNSNMTFIPLQYSLSRFNICDTLPEKEWILENFLSLVRTEFSDKQQILPNNWPVKINKTIALGDNFIDNISANSESVIYIDRKTKSIDSTTSVAEDVYSLLCNPKVGDKNNAYNVDREAFIERFTSELSENKRLLFVLPGFPFKDQNRFRVPYQADEPDMAEIAFMLRLYRLTQSLYQEHPYGADIVVLTDGELYCELFDVDSNEVEKYQNKLLYYRNKLNLQATVSFISIKEMIDRANETGIIDKILKHIKNILKQFINSKANSEFNLAFNTLKKGMKWNINSKYTAINVDDSVCWDIICSECSSVSPDYVDLWNKIDEKASEIALQYATINLMLKKTSLIQCFFPDSIRGTVHPKPEQFALAGSPSYAWNGVAWSKSWPNTIDDFHVCAIKDLCDEKAVNQVVSLNTGLPLFFTASDYKPNIHNAQKAFPMKKHIIANLQIKPFKDSDAKFLDKLGKNDPNFNWSRVTKDDEYYEELLKFRIEHYKKYGFGVYGIWHDNELIGQVGLQVLDYDSDQVECVIFLGKKHTGQKIGSALLHYIIESCKSNKMNNLFAVVRPDNDIGIALAKKFGGVSISNVTHYDEKGIKFKINLMKVV